MRHPTEVPIEVWKDQTISTAKLSRAMKDISTGGLAFICTTDWQPGTTIRIRLPLVNPPFETEGRIVWCRKRQAYYEVGVAFMKPNDAFTVRMVEQICQIEMYRKSQEGAGRHLSSEEAAMEWIKLYAEKFSEKVNHWRPTLQH